MSNPRFETTRGRGWRLQEHCEPGQQEQRNIASDADLASNCLLVALGMLVAGSIVWFGIAPPQNTHETAATRAPVADIETTGRSGPVLDLRPL